MLIRSQDKKSLINMDNVTDLSVVSGSEIMACYTTDQGYQRIGKYSDESKAIKVLDMIQACYADVYTDNQTYFIDYPKVFDMPQESDV
jgi:hypothetical protein